jgi:hypothetical protein
MFSPRPWMLHMIMRCNEPAAVCSTICRQEYRLSGTAYEARPTNPQNPLAVAVGFQTIPGLSRRYVTDFGPCPIPTMAATTMQSVAAKPSSCEFSQVRGQNIMSRVTTRGDS